MFEVTKGNMKILFESPFLVADYVYKNTDSIALGNTTFDILCDLEVGEFDHVAGVFTNDGEAILIEKVSYCDFVAKKQSLPVKMWQ